MSQLAQGPEEEHDLVIWAILDFQGQLIKLTAGQWSHILRGHSYMSSMDPAIRETLEHPQEVHKSRYAPNTNLYYRWYAATVKGDKWACVVVKFLQNAAFISTAYLTNKIKEGELLWPKEA